MTPNELAPAFVRLNMDLKNLYQILTYNKHNAKAVALPSEAHCGIIPWLSYFLS
jgi:hypothetical protein